MLMSFLSNHCFNYCACFIISFCFLFDVDIFPFLTEDSYAGKQFAAFRARLNNDFALKSFSYFFVFYFLWYDWFLYVYHMNSLFFDWGLYTGMSPVKVFGWSGFEQVFWFVDAQVYFRNLNETLYYVLIIAFVLNVFFLTVLYDRFFSLSDRRCVYENLPNM